MHTHIKTISTAFDCTRKMRVASAYCTTHCSQKFLNIFKNIQYKMQWVMHNSRCYLITLNEEYTQYNKLRYFVHLFHAEEMKLMQICSQKDNLFSMTFILCETQYFNIGIRIHTYARIQCTRIKLILLTNIDMAVDTVHLFL